jgi:hypothetical protein
LAHLMRPGHALRVPTLASRHSPRLVYALFVLAASAISIATITTVAYWSDHPLVVPSLGPTAFLVFNRSQTPRDDPGISESLGKNRTLCWVRSTREIVPPLHSPAFRRNGANMPVPEG